MARPSKVFFSETKTANQNESCDYNLFSYFVANLLFAFIPFSFVKGQTLSFETLSFVSISDYRSLALTR